MSLWVGGIELAYPYGRKWSKYRLKFLSEHPLCACGAKATVVDHIVPWKNDIESLFWEPTNHRPNCKRCHDQKTAKFDGGFGNKVKTAAEPEKVTGACGGDGLPVDSNHPWNK